MHARTLPVRSRSVHHPARARARSPLRQRTTESIGRCVAGIVAAGLLVLMATAARALPLQITTTTLAGGVAGVSYASSIETISGTPPLAWSIDSGSLPVGLTLGSSTGVISGTATLAGTSPFIVRATDALGDTATAALSITIVHAAAAALAFAVGPSDVVAGVAISPTVQVQVSDAFGNAVPGELVSLALLGTGTLSGGAAVASDASGFATFSALSVNLVGAKQLTAASGLLPPVTSGTFVVSAAAAASLAFAVGPSNVVAGVAISPAVQVSVSDAFGNVVAGQLVSLALVGTGTLSGSTPVASDVNGLSTFSAVSVDLVGTKQLTAAAGLLAPVTSAPFVVSPAPIALLAFQVQPAGVLVNATITPAVQVKATDAFGNPTPGASVSLTLVGVGVLSGAAPVATDAAGLSTFLSLSVDRAGSFQLSASSGLAGPVLSTAFTVSCPVITVLPATLPIAQFGAQYVQQLSGSGATTPYTFAVTLGVPPTGLTLTPAGLLSGFPSVTGLFTFTVTATSTNTGACTGATAYSINVPVLPAAVTNLTATRLIATNDASGIAKIQIAFTTTPNTTSAEVYRAPFGGYPRYDDAGGLQPPTPSYPPGAPWVLTAVTATGQTDKPATRDVWSYVVFMKNSFGQPSAVSNKPAGVPDYALGDVSNAVTAGTGDNLVNAADMSLLGAHYGISGIAITSGGFSYLDVGPTIDFAMTSRPFTDNRIDFEDFVVFAINFGAVASPAAVVAGADAAARAASTPEHLTLLAPSLVEAGATFAVPLRMEAAGRVQGLSAELDWDPSVVEPVAVTSSDWVEAQQGMVLSPRPGSVDLALLGARESGLAGAGELATFTFRARRVGDPAIRIARVVARDAANRTLTASALTFGALTAAPARTVLLAPYPNPASGPATVAFALSQAGGVDLAIYSVDGRRIRTLTHSDLAAGSYRYNWTGDDDQHRPVAPGVYYARLLTAGRRFSRTLVHLK